MLTRIIVLTAVLVSGVITAHAAISARALTQPISAAVILLECEDQDNKHHHHYKTNDMPEPGSLALLVAGLLGTIAVARRTGHK